jgi:hypothetical protein
VALLLDRILANCYSGEEKAKSAGANCFALVVEKEMNGQITEEADDNKRVQAANSIREGFESTSHQESLVPRGKESSPTNPSQVKPGSHPQSRGASGPRTAQGKQRSKYNAVKHGIFAAVVLPKSESRVQYESLLRGLLEDLCPHGRLEETLVEKLAMLLWRHRRLIRTEIAEIRNSTELLELEEENRQPPRLIITSSLSDETEDLDGLEKFLKAQVLIEESSPDECKEFMLKGSGDLIERLKSKQRMQRFLISRRAALARIRLQVPHPPDLDRLLRYEASIERSFDRTLSQLERLQRMRLGHPVPPPLQVNVSSNDVPAT